MEQTFLERYYAGEHEQVWNELAAYGALIRQEPIYSDAKAVAHETMLRAKQNISLLVKRLHFLRYRFVFPEEIWIPPDPTSLAALEAREQHYGVLPISLHMWFVVVGSVNFMGAHPKLSEYTDFWQEEYDEVYPGHYADPLVISPFIEDLILPYEPKLGEDRDVTSLFDFWFAPDAAHKANYSGGGPTSIHLPSLAADARLYSDDWDGCMFTSYLRTYFQWGGFPGLRHNSPPQPEELVFLTKELLPL